MDLSDLLAPLALFAVLLAMGVMIVRDRQRADSELSPKVRRAREGFDRVAALPSALLALVVVFAVIHWLSAIEVSLWLLVPTVLAVLGLAFYAVPAGVSWISVAAIIHLKKKYALDDGETRELVAAIYPGKGRERVERRLLGDRDRQEDDHTPT